MFSYDQSFQPPAPVLDVVVSRPDGTGSLAVRAMLDSGSSLTALPLHVLRALSVPFYDQLLISGYEDTKAEVQTFIVALDIDGRRIWPLEVAGLSRDDAILGRDVLNQFIVTLDGPGLFFEMQRPPQAEG